MAIVPIMLLSIKTIRRIGKRLRPIGNAIMKIQPSLSAILPKIGLEVEPEEYAAGSFVSSLIYGVLFFVIGLLAIVAKNGLDAEIEYNVPLALGLSFWLLFLVLHLIYPSIIVKKIATKESKDLLFALREIMVDVESGIPLFESMKNVVSSEYGYISKDFEWAVRQIESGVPEREALKNLALKSESEYMRRAIWQMVNALESGASMGTALPGIVQSLENYLYREIKNYSSNLNFMMLLYMLGAAAVPSLGVTFLVLLSAFGDFGVTVETVEMLVAGSAIFQIAMIGYMSSTRPEIFGG